jgi:cell division transport system permease protein
MKGLKLFRTFQEGLKNYLRNGWLTVATIVVMTLSLFIVSMTLMFGITTQLVLDGLQDKINISISFNEDVLEDTILDIQQTLSKYKEVASVGYISKDKALEQFMVMGNQDPVIAQALDEIGENPLLASLVIKAHTADQYDTIAQALPQSSFKDDINRINYEKNKTAINRLNSINVLIQKVGMILGIIFLSISFLITFNTIRINMHSRRSEFEIMRLVGASNIYVRMPSVFEGILYGLSAAITTLILLFIALQSILPLTESLIDKQELFGYYEAHFLQISLAVTGVSVALGILGGFVAVRKYLKF